MFRKSRKVHGMGRRAVVGMTLAEILVAMTVFVIAAAVAMILYNALTRSYKLGDNATEMQQNTRIAFDRMLDEIRMAGFNYNPDGATRPDEQIEGAWETVLAIRGDFDHDDPARRNVPEVFLAAGMSPYDIVSVGNDEIVTYALAKPDGTGGATATFVADVLPLNRDGVAEVVNVPNVALVQNNPPYTLYRINVRNGMNAVERIPVADNIYSLDFRYFDGAGQQLGNSTPSDPTDDIGGADSIGIIALRARIRRVEVTITGMTPDPDLRFIDQDDPIAATRNHRKFTLTQDVFPRNLGFVGRPDTDTTPPTTPANVQACPGHCESMIVTWDAPAASELVSQWTVLRQESGTPLGDPVVARSMPAYVPGLTDGTTYLFRVRAEDSTGNASPLSNPAASGTVADGTTPGSNLVRASGDTGGALAPLDETIAVEFTPVLTNVETISCDPQPNRIRDLKGYRLHRSTSATFTAGPGTVYVDTDLLPSGSMRYDDDSVVSCRRYYYQVQAVDKCDNVGALSNLANGMATTQYVPAQVQGMQAIPAGTDTVNLSWFRVTENTNTPPDTILVDTYRLQRVMLPSGTPPSTAASDGAWASAASIDVQVTDVNMPTFTDPTAYSSALPGGYSYYYRAAALSDCPSPLDIGAFSAPREAAACSFDGYIYVDPADGSSVTGYVSVQMYVTGPSITYDAFLVITDERGAVVAQHGSPAAPLQGTSFPDFAWDTTALPAGPYQITATATDENGCSSSVTSTVSVSAPVTCCVSPLAPVLGPTRGQTSQQNTDLLFSLVNNCGKDLLVVSQEIRWQGNTSLYTGTTPGLTGLCWDVPAGTAPEDCTPVVTFTNPVGSGAFVPFDPPLSFTADRHDLNPLNAGYQFTSALLVKDNRDQVLASETIDVRIGYRSAGQTSDAFCTFRVQPEQLSVSIEP